MRIKDLGDEDDYNNKPKTNIYDSLKKTSTVLDQETGEIKSDPMEGIPVGKIKGVQGNSKVRELLAGLNPEKD